MTFVAGGCLQCDRICRECEGHDTLSRTALTRSAREPLLRTAPSEPLAGVLAHQAAETANA